MKKWQELTATCFYIGYSPAAPGTLGSLAGLGLIAILYFFQTPALFYILITTVIFCVGLLSAKAVSDERKMHDPQIVVIDEVVGMMIALFGISQAKFIVFLSGFLLFRLFDIWKPFPIRKLEAFPNGVGIMLDDVLAGIYANLCLRLFHLL